MKQSERLPDNATALEKFIKYSEIVELLKESGIKLFDIDNGGNPILVDESCDFKITHSINTWNIFTRQEVADMIIQSRDKFKETRKL